MDTIPTKQWLLNKIMITEKLIKSNKNIQDLEKKFRYDDDMQRFMELIEYIGIVKIPKKTIKNIEKQVITNGGSDFSEKELKKLVSKRIFFVFIKNAKSRDIDIRKLIQKKLNFNIMENYDSDITYRLFGDFFSIFFQKKEEIGKIFMENNKYRAVYYLENDEKNEAVFDEFRLAFNFIKENFKNN